MLRWPTPVLGALATAWLALSAATLVAQNPGGSPEARKVKNPVAPNAASLKMGAQLFQKNCVFCHGDKGLGDGKLIPKDMKPANLADDKWDRGSTDGEIFAVIANGAGPEFKMKGVKGRLSDTDIWHLVNYVRSLGPKTAAR
jgi:mono/diheme cytochrome c family protein